MEHIWNKINNYRFSVLYFWTVFFVVLLIISIAVSGFIYSNAIKSIQNEMMYSYNLELGRIKFTVDEKIREMRRLALEQSMSNEIVQLCELSSTTPQSRMSMWQIQKRLREYSLLNSFIDDIVIGFISMDRAISNKSVYSIEEVSHLLLGGNLINELINKDNKNNYYLINNNKYDSYEYKIIYLLSLPLVSGSSNNAFILITISTNDLSPLFTTYNNRLIVLSDLNNSVTISNSSNVDARFLNSGDYLVFESDSSAKGISYHYYVSNDDLLEKISSINQKTLISLAFCIFIFIFSTIIFVKKNYNPISKILGSINSLHNQKKTYSQNELIYIEKSLSKLIEERQLMINDISQNEKNLKDYFLIKTLLGEVNLLDDKKNGTMSLIPSDGCAYIIIINVIKQTSNKVTVCQIEKDAVFIQEILSLEFSGSIIYVVGIENYMVAVVISNRILEKEEYKTKVSNIVADTRGIINSRIIVSASQELINSSELSKGYQQAKDFQEYCVLFDKDYAIYFKPSSNFENNNKYQSDLYKQFSNCICTGNFKYCKILLDKIFADCFCPDQQTYVTKLSMMGLINIVTNAVSEFLNSRILPIDLDEITKSMINCKSINKLKYTIIKILEAIETELNQYQSKFGNKIVKEIIDYIKNSYDSYDLSVSSLAEKFGVTVPYLSRLFKKETNIGLLDYIHSVRISEAKKILASGKYNVYEVAEAVGYMNSSAFIKLFRKHEGVSPGKYAQHINIHSSGLKK